MRVGIESCTWANRRGYGRFTRRLVAALVHGFPEHEFTLVLDDRTAAEGEFPERAARLVVPTSDQPVRAASAGGSRRVSDMWRLGRAVSRARFDVYYFPTRYAYYPVLGPTPLVMTFHDATGERHPHLLFPDARARLFWRLKSRLALLQADRLVTVSEDARTQIAAAFALDPAGIEVISEGPDPVFRLLPATAAAGVRARYRLPALTPLVLYVGGISPHKNLGGLLGALSALAGDWHAVLVGDHQGDGFLACHGELVALARELGIGERITFTGYVPDEDLALLYTAATLLVLPSLGEGFGLPVLEAMACGLPVAASRASSLPEILGEAGTLFDPADPGDMAGAIARLLADPELRQAQRERGLVRAAHYTWERGAATLMRVLTSVARS